MSLIENLTPEQEALIPVYRQKWRAIALSTEKINRKKAVKSINKAYALNDLAKPEIIFIDSPRTVISSSRFSVWIEPRGELDSYLLSQFRNQLGKSIWNLISANLFHTINIDQEILIDLYSSIKYLTVDKRFKIDGYNTFEPKYWLAYSCLFDFCISVLNCAYPARHLQAMQDVAEYCGLIFCSESLVVMCERPTKLSFDNQNRLHAEGEPAIEFTDGYSLYSYHGVTLPEKYGKIHPQQWQSQWLLTEENAELRRVLIQGIGYARICQELQAIELDFWKEYILLKIDNDVDEEPIYLLKMTCPSTGFIHALRVPPEMNSAREAIRWVNWGIEPEEFAVQT
ncbi:DUF6745 domain-containing protein [uncultured Nostoc sp.]|uniref:DUF6745 domain-containing protein n=1 Tax=uncultured Nostoc sp. TaxID=340711 RepID=UPI0035CBCD46